MATLQMIVTWNLLAFLYHVYDTGTINNTLPLHEEEEAPIPIVHTSVDSACDSFTSYDVGQSYDVARMDVVNITDDNDTHKYIVDGNANSVIEPLVAATIADCTDLQSIQLSQ